MKTIEVKRQLLEEALDQLKKAQQDCYVLCTQNVIDELEVVLRQPNTSSALPMSEIVDCGKDGRFKLCNVCGNAKRQ